MLIAILVLVCFLVGNALFTSMSPRIIGENFARLEAKLDTLLELGDGTRSADEILKQRRELERERREWEGKKKDELWPGGPL